MFHIPIDCKRLEADVSLLEQKPVETGKVLFYGDDTFACWDHILEDPSGYVNHGLKGATAEDLLYYYSRLVRPYKPSVLVISFGYNDIGCFGWEYSPEEAMTNITRLCHWAKTDFPGIRILLTEMTPLVQDRWVGGERDEWVYFFHVTKSFNEQLRLFAQTTENVEILTLWDKEVFFETAEGVGNPRNIRLDLYEEDEIHYNAAGYEVLAKLLRPEVAKYV